MRGCHDFLKVSLFYFMKGLRRVPRFAWSWSVCVKEIIIKVDIKLYV
jgi:hypothetical protein